MTVFRSGILNIGICDKDCSFVICESEVFCLLRLHSKQVVSVARLQSCESYHTTGVLLCWKIEVRHSSRVLKTDLCILILIIYSINHHLLSKKQSVVCADLNNFES